MSIELIKTLAITLLAISLMVTLIMYYKLRRIKTNSTIEKNDNKWFFRNWIWFVSLGIVIVWGCTFFLLLYDSDKGLGDTGKFGDMFGAVNALFSGFAFAGMIYAIRLQSRELSQTNKEMEVQNEILQLQKEELSETRGEFKKQNQTLVLQRFETTFFHLLTQHHQILDNLSFRVGSKSYVKRNVIDYFSKILVNSHRGRYTEVKTSGEGYLKVDSYKMPLVNSHESAFKSIQQSYDKCFDHSNHSILSHYFRNLYHIFKFISQSKEIPTERQQFYASLVVAQLSQEEQLLIFHNMMIPSLGYPKFLFLDKRFDILGNMSEKQLEEYPWQIELFKFLKDDLPGKIDLNEKSSISPNF